MSSHAHAHVTPASSPAPGFTPAPSRLLQRTCACGGTPDVDRMCEACREKRLSGVQTKLVVNQPGDRYEQEADRIADQVMRMPATAGQRQAVHEEEEEDEDQEEMLPAKQAAARASALNPSIEAGIQGVRQGGGQPLYPATPAVMESRFGHDFRHMRIHTATAAANAARAVRARAFTIGSDVVFGQGQYTPGTREGRRLLAHELAHVVQQRHTLARATEFPSTPDSECDGEREAQVASGIVGKVQTSRVSNHSDSASVQRQIDPAMGNPLDDPRMHPSGAPKAKACSPPSWCPEHFCQPYSSESYAIQMRTKMLPVLMAGIAFAVNSRVVPLWHDHLLGGSAPRDLTSQFGKDFTSSKTTTVTTGFLLGELQKNLQTSPPIFPIATLPVNVDIASRIGSAIAEKRHDRPVSRRLRNIARASCNRSNFTIRSHRNLWRCPIHRGIPGKCKAFHRSCRYATNTQHHPERDEGRGAISVKRPKV